MRLFREFSLLRTDWLGLAAAIVIAFLPNCRSPETNPSSVPPTRDAELSALRRQLAASRNELASLQKDLEEKQRRIDALTSQLQTAQRRIRDQNTEIQGLARSVSALERDADRYRQRVEAAEKERVRLGSVSKELRELRSQFAAIQIRYQAELAEKEQIISRLNGKAARPAAGGSPNIPTPQ